MTDEAASRIVSDVLEMTAPAAPVEPETPDVFDPDDLAAIRRELDTIDPGPLATTQDEADLNRYVRRIMALRSERERIAAATRSMLAAIDSKIEGTEFVYRARAEDIARRMLASQRGKSKSVKTPFGTAAFRTVPAKLVVTDELALLADAGGNVGLAGVVETVTTTRVDRAKLAEYFEATGELPAGVTIEPPRESFSVR